MRFASSKVDCVTYCLEPLVDRFLYKVTLTKGI